MTTHRLLLDQIETQGSVLDNEMIKPAAREALNRIKQQIDEEGDQVDTRPVRNGKTVWGDYINSDTRTILAIMDICSEKYVFK